MRVVLENRERGLILYLVVLKTGFTNELKTLSAVVVNLVLSVQNVLINVSLTVLNHFMDESFNDRPMLF